MKEDTPTGYRRDQHRRRVPPLLAAAGALGALSLSAVIALAGCRPGGAPSEAEPPANSEAIHQIRTVSESERKQFVGNQECARCHQKEAAQNDSHHAHTLARVTREVDGPRFRQPSGVRDPDGGWKYHTSVEGDACVMTVSGAGKPVRVRAEYGLGSGNRAVTYVGKKDGQPLELRVTHYRQAGKWDFTPGHQVGTEVRDPAGRPLSPQQEEQCFSCHATALVREGGRIQPERSLLGVTCEACHGPGAAHLEAVRLGAKDLKMVRLSGMGQRVSMELCGQCHRDAHAGNPNDPLAASQLPRMQGAALALSACFRKSEGRLTCVTCHNPHRNAQRATDADYNRTCVSCHSPHTQGQSVCGFRPQGNCVSCHMPEQEVEMPTRPRFRTHWIKLWAPTSR